jgi:hypothetical protein
VADGDGTVLGQATSVNGAPAVILLAEQECGTEATTLDAVVFPVGGERVASPYRLSRRGGY